MNEYGLLFSDGTPANFVTVYLVTREYGGPEEGGWYYDQYSKKHSFDVSEMNRGDAKQLLESLDAWSDSLGEINYWSVASRGKHVILIESEEGESETRGRPAWD